MSKTLKHLALLLGLTLALSVSGEEQSLPDELFKSLDVLGQNPTLLKVINRHNLKVINMAQIKRRNEMWKHSPKGRVLIKAAMRNPASAALKEFAESMPYLQEVVLMDRRGINIAMNQPSDNYWVGDQDEWSNPIATGKRYVSETNDVAKVEFLKVSTPILSDGKTVGVLMVSLDTKAL